MDALIQLFNGETSFTVELSALKLLLPCKDAASDAPEKLADLRGNRGRFPHSDIEKVSCEIAREADHALINRLMEEDR